MRKQIAAANWKMNKRLDEGKILLENILNGVSSVNANQEVVFAVPFPYLLPLQSLIEGKQNISLSAQNCHHKTSGAYTGEVSIDMLDSININYCIVGHSERREYFAESNEVLAEKVMGNWDRKNGIFCTSSRNACSLEISLGWKIWNRDSC